MPPSTCDQATALRGRFAVGAPPRGPARGGSLASSRNQAIGTSSAVGEGGQRLERRRGLVVLDLAQVADVQPRRLGDAREGQRRARRAGDGCASRRAVVGGKAAGLHRSHYACKKRVLTRAKGPCHDMAINQSRLASAKHHQEGTSSTMKVAIIGAGNVGKALGTSITRAGHDVTISAQHSGERPTRRPRRSARRSAAEQRRRGRRCGRRHPRDPVRRPARRSPTRSVTRVAGKTDHRRHESDEARLLGPRHRPTARPPRSSRSACRRRASSRRSTPSSPPTRPARPGTSTATSPPTTRRRSSRSSRSSSRWASRRSTSDR